MRSNFNHKYKKYKSKYLNLKQANSIQSGGGAWGSFSNQNDYTQDAMMDYGFIDYENSKHTYNKNLTATTTGLKKFLADSTKEIKEKPPRNPKVKYTECMNYLGIVIQLLLDFYPVEKKYLEKALMCAYKDYIKIYKEKDKSDWTSYKDGLDLREYEIGLIDYAIKTGTPIKVPRKYLLDSNKKDSAKIIDESLTLHSNEHLSNYDLTKFMDEYVKKNHPDIFNSNAMLSNEKFR